MNDSTTHNLVVLKGMHQNLIQDFGYVICSMHSLRESQGVSSDIYNILTQFRLHSSEKDEELANKQTFANRDTLNDS